VIDPLYKVKDQLKTFIADGTATNIVKNEKTIAEYVEMPMMNMWCAQTKNAKTAIATDENATAE
jgi:hypothetical protein